ncbi:MAG: outer membrane protein transport protein [Pseudolabrys sp.]|jgi:long-chain fatty acid transport protein
MSRRAWDGVLRAGTALGLLVIASAQANAGGLAVREQSAYGQGSSFAGVAAGGALSSMFWNPATMTQVPGVVSETVVSGIFPYANNTPTAGTLVGAPFNLGGTSNIGNAALVPAGYTSYQLSPNLWFGVSINAPFGLSESYPDNWAGRFYASGDQLLKTYNATPSLAWQINNWISVGAGVQIQYAKASFQKGVPGGPGFGGLPGGLGGTGSFATLEGTGWGFGATAGVTLTPTPTTTIGLGWRSAINQKIEGTLLTSGSLPSPPFPATTTGSINTTVDLPDVVSLGIRQRLDPQWTLLGTVEWTNWSRIGTASILQLSGAPATLLGTPVVAAFQWQDGWFFSGGAEYIWSDRLTVRGGLGYEISPVTDQVRTPLVPDNDRFWASVGATWQVIKGMHFDVAYSHIWVKDPNINLVAGNPTFITGFGGLPYVGNVNAHVDILSLALVMRLDEIGPTARKP